MKISNRILTSHGAAALLTAAFSLASPQPAGAINIVMTFDDTNSLTPAFDSDGSQLTALFDYAEDFYEDVFKHAGHTLNITFRYSNLTGFIGLHTYQGADGNGRENQALIQIDPSIGGGGWWIDPTPGNDNEFTMTQTLWRDLTTGSTGQRADWYNVVSGSTPPDTFEAGFTGAATAGGGAQGATDMLSVVLHEVGHALGMSSSNPLTVAQTVDGDYDFFTTFVAEQNFGIETANNSGDDNANIAHVENTNALMTPSIGASTRRRPSHSDLFAMATVNFYNNTTVDVPRKEFYATDGTNWNNPDNWSGHRVPDSDDDVYIRDAKGPGTVITSRLNANGVADDLFVSEGGNFDTNAFKLTVDDDVFVSDTDSDIFINPGGELEADHVFIQNSAEIEMDGGTLDVRRLTIEPGTQLEGRTNTMTIDVSERLTNNGTIVANDNANMTFVSVDPDAWNLDGAGDNDGNGLVNASNGNMTFSGSAMSDGFSGTMRIGAGHFITMGPAWTLNTGTLDLNGGADLINRARINGGQITMTGGLVDAVGVSHINAQINISGGTVDLDNDDVLEFNNDTTISGGVLSVGPGSRVEFDDITIVSDGTFTLSSGGTINFDSTTNLSGTPVFNTPSPDSADGRVNFRGTTTYAGGTIDINGFARQNGNATVSTDSVINAETFDFDGDTNPLWTINKELVINADLIDSGEFFNNTIDSNININNPGIFLIGSTAGGTLEVNLPGESTWLLNGTTNLDGSVDGGLLTFIPTMIDGSFVAITGTLNMQDRGSVGARASIIGTVNTADAASIIRFIGGDLTDTNTMVGGSINGSGIVGSIAGRALVGNGTINTRIDFNDTAELRANSGELTINGALLDVGTLGTASGTGVLNVTYNWNTNVTDLVELQGGSIIGGILTNATSQTITGFGTLSPAQIINNGTIAADGGELIVDVPGNPDLDGGTGDGILEAVNGDLTVVDQVTDAHGGTANVGANRTMTFQLGWATSSDGAINLNGGASLANAAVVAGSNQDLQGTTNVDQHGAFQIPTTFNSFSNTNVPDADDVLHLQANSEIFLGAAFSGLGTIINHAGNTLLPDDNVDIAVNFSNAGTVVLNGSTLFGGNFTNQSTGLFTGFGVLSPNALNNNGTIAPSASTITVDTAANPDLDGTTENGTVQAINGNLVIADPLADAFHGTGAVGTGRVMTFQQGWTLGNGGAFKLSGGPNLATAAVLNVPLPHMQAINGTVSVTGFGEFNAKSGIGPTAKIAIVNAVDRLVLDGNTALAAGAAFGGAGSLVNLLGSTLDAADGADIDVAYFNVGTTVLNGKLTGANFVNELSGLIVGFGILGPNQVNNNGLISAKGGTLTLDYAVNPNLDGSSNNGQIQAVNGDLVIADPVTDIFDGTATVGGKQIMTFQQGWTLGSTGNLIFNGGPDTATAAVLRVNGPAAQAVRGNVDVNGVGVFAADSNIAATANVGIPTAADSLILDGDTNVAAGAPSQAGGTLINLAGSTLTLADGATIGVDTISDGNIELGASPGAATISATLRLGNNSNLHIEVLLPSPVKPRPRRRRRLRPAQRYRRRTPRRRSRGHPHPRRKPGSRHALRRHHLRVARLDV